jgi:hypothetical protein
MSYDLFAHAVVKDLARGGGHRIKDLLSRRGPVMALADGDYLVRRSSRYKLVDGIQLLFAEFAAHTLFSFWFGWQIAGGQDARAKPSNILGHRDSINEPPVSRTISWTVRRARR